MLSVNEPQDKENSIQSSANTINKRNVNTAIKYLGLLKDPELIIKSDFAFDSLRALYLDCFSDKNKYELVDLILNDSIELILLNLMNYQYSNFIEKLNLNQINFSISDLKILEMVTKLMLYFTNQSVKFCSRIHEIKELKTFFKYVTNDFLIEMITEKIEFEKQYLPKFKRIMRALLGSLHNLSKVSKKFKTDWLRLDATNTLIKLSERYESFDVIKNTIYIIIGSIATDKEIDTLSKIHSVVIFIIEIIQKCVKQYENKEKTIRRIKIQIDDNGEYSKIIYIIDKSWNWNLYELIMALYNLAVNDNIKFGIYFTNNMKDNLKLIINEGNNEEIEYGLKLLWQLCFDKRIAEDVFKDENFYEKLKILKANSNERIVKGSQGVLWQIEPKNIQEQLSSNLSENETKFKTNLTSDEIEKHIMISYNRESRDLCLKIKEELEKDGHKVWIDVESIHGSSLESMANAIENSKCVLMCMTEKYKQSPPCRAEAEYAFQLNKPIIPLIMQNNYKPDGWLGIILGSKIFIHFMKYEFKECIRRLKEEVTASKTIIKVPNKPKEPSQDIPKFNDDKIDKNNTLISNDDEIKWTHREVEIWFKEKNLSHQILDQLSPCDGKILKQLKTILKTAPEFFYHSLTTTTNGLNLREIAVFTYELNNIFNNES